jgi:hypothetical protein
MGRYIRKAMMNPRATMLMTGTRNRSNTPMAMIRNPAAM